MSRSEIRKQKSALRQECRSLRRGLSEEEIAAEGEGILERLLGIEEFAAAGLIHTYVSSKENEVDTHGLIRASLDRGKRVAIPVVVQGTRLLRHAEIERLEGLVADAWGLLEPRIDHAAWVEDTEEIDLVVVPGLIFDRRGGRLGFGGGFYDRFLEYTRAFRVGLVYDCLLLDEVPMEAHDVRVDVVITGTGIYRTGVR